MQTASTRSRRKTKTLLFYTSRYRSLNKQEHTRLTSQHVMICHLSPNLTNRVFLSRKRSIMKRWLWLRWYLINLCGKCGLSVPGVGLPEWWIFQAGCVKSSCGCQDSPDTHSLLINLLFRRPGPASPISINPARVNTESGLMHLDLAPIGPQRSEDETHIQYIKIK